MRNSGVGDALSETRENGHANRKLHTYIYKKISAARKYPQSSSERGTTRAGRIGVRAMQHLLPTKRIGFRELALAVG